MSSSSFATRFARHRRSKQAPPARRFAPLRESHLLLVAMRQHYERCHLYPMVVKDLKAAINTVIIPLLLSPIIVIPPLNDLMVRLVQMLEHLLGDAPLVAVGCKAAAGVGVGEGADGEAAAGAVNDELLRLSHADHRLAAAHVRLKRSECGVSREGVCIQCTGAGSEYCAFYARRLYDSHRSSLIFMGHGANLMNSSLTCSCCATALAPSFLSDSCDAVAAAFFR